jgi:hypothetical protein
MEYIYGTDGDQEILKTVGDVHSDLEGFFTSSRERSGVTVIDRCRILDHFRTDEDASGKKYDWYTITDHFHYEDRQVASRISDDAIAEILEMIQLHDDTLAEILEMIGG